MTRPKAIVRIVYALGLVLAAFTAINGLTDESPIEWVVGPAMGLAIWWIAAGIAVRIEASGRDRR